jgi:4-aminobutyrate--pyruvate transaminase
VGLIGALELVADKATKQPFPPARGVGAFVSKRAEAHGLIVRVIAGDIVAFSPPLIIEAADIAEILARIGRALDDTVAWLRDGK